MSDIKKVLFIGSKKLGLLVLQEMFALSPKTLTAALTIDDTSDNRCVLSDFQRFTENNKIELHIAKNKLHTEELIQKIKPDLCFVVGWYWLISKTTLDSVPHGFIGIHNSLLPKYRGGSPLIWTVINNENEVGFSFFTLTPGLDDGSIWAQGIVPIEEQEFISDILKKIERKVVEVFRDHYLKTLKHAIKPIEQRHEMATYCAQRYPKDGNVDWRQPAKDIYNLIRAQSDPYPGAFTFCNGKMLKIWKAIPYEKVYYGTPGQVAMITSDGVYVICGDHRAIILKDVEFDSKKGKAQDFIKSIKSRMYSNR